MAVTSSGTLGLFGEHHSVVFEVDGTVRTVREGADSPFDDTILSAAGSRRDTFWAVTQSGDGTETKVLDLDLDRIGGAEIDPGQRHVLPLPDGRMLLLGEADRRTPRGELCEGAPPLGCKTFTPPQLLFLGRQFEDATILEDGALVLGALTGLVVFEGLPPQSAIAAAPTQTERADDEDQAGVVVGTSLHWRAFALHLVALNGTVIPIPPGDLRSVGAVGSFLVACVQTEATHVMMTRIDRAVVTSTRAPPALVEIETAPQTCRPFVTDPDGRLRMTLASGHSVAIDRTGEVQITEAFQPPQTTIPIGGASTAFGHTVAWTGEVPVEVFFRRAGTTSFVPRFGDPTLRSGRVAGFVVRGDEVEIIHVNGLVQVRRADGSGEERRLTPLEPRDSISAVAANPRDGSLLVAVEHPRSASLARTEPLGSTLIEQPDLDAGDVRRMSTLGPGRFAMLTFDGRILVLDGDRLQTAEIDFDDPSTEETEPDVSFDNLPCEPSYTGGPLKSISSAGGRTFISGCAGLLFNLNPFSTPPRAQRIIIDRSSQSLFDEVDGGRKPLLSSVLAVCSDDVLIGGRPLQNIYNERGLTWELTTDAPGDVCSEPYLDRCLRDAPDAIASTDVFSGNPVSIAGDRDGIFEVFNAGTFPGGSIQRLGNLARYRFPEPLLDAFQAPWGEVFVASSSGRLLHGARR